jgi:hypothetical protein
VLVSSYAAFHPFREVSFGLFTSTRGTTHAIVELKNNGFADLTVFSTDVPATTGAFPSFRQPLEGAIIRGRNQLNVLISAEACTAGVIHIRYRMLGREWTQPMQVPDRCA